MSARIVLVWGFANEHSDQDLEILLDRSKEAMARKVGWSAGLAKGKAGAEQRKKGEKTAFEVSS